jgi:hypothetical protein
MVQTLKSEVMMTFENGHSALSGKPLWYQIVSVAAPSRAAFCCVPGI